MNTVGLRRSTRSITRTLICIGTSIFLPTAFSFAGPNAYKETILVASNASYEPLAFVDPHIENAWGIALRPPGIGGHIWISNARNASTSLYLGDVNGKPLHQDGLKIIQMDGPLLSYEGGLPQVTGQVYNAASDFAGQPIEFPVKGPGSNWSSGTPKPLGIISGATKFVFVTKDGTVNAWRAGTASSMNTAVIAMDYSDHGKDQVKGLAFLPAFTGVAMTTDAAKANEKGERTVSNRLYVTDFQNKIIRVIDNQWRDITASVPFERPEGLKEGMSPYNIQYLDGRLYVTYAVVDTTMDEPAFDVPEEGGHVFAYDRDGHLLHGFKDEGKLQSPWGLAIAPATFGPFAGKLLVASFGDGTIAAFDPQSGEFLDHLKDPQGEPLKLDGVWGLVFGNGVALGDANALYYTAGPNKEQDGVFGRVNYVGDKAQTAPTKLTSAPAATPSKDARKTVRDFGAIGDGKADDTAAIERAIQAGSVTFPKGTYRLSRTIKVDLLKTGTLALHGEAGATLVTAAAGPALHFNAKPEVPKGPILAEDDPATKPEQPKPALTIEGLEITGEDASTDGIEIIGATRLSVNGTSFAKLRHGLRLLECTDSKLNGLQLKEAGREGAALLLDGCNRVTVQDCTILDSAATGLALVKSERCLVSGCVIRSDKPEQNDALSLKREGGSDHWIHHNWLANGAEGLEQSDLVENKLPTKTVVTTPAAEASSVNPE